MAFDERFVFEDSTMDNIIYNEHKARYDFACQFVKGKIVLDIASGSGFGSSLLAGAGAASVAGVDLDKSSVEKAQGNYRNVNLKYLPGSALEIPLADKSIDVVVSFETIEHLEDYRKFLSEVRRVLRDDGLFLVSTPNKKVFGEKNPYHLKEFERVEFESLLKEYFPVAKLFDQVNSLASTIDCGEGTASFSVNNKVDPHYFLAICSNYEFSVPQRTFINSNPQALERLKNNPVLKLSDVVYGFLGKFFKNK